MSVTGTVTATDTQKHGAPSAAELVPRHVVALETGLALLHAALRSLLEAPASEADVRPAAEALGRAITAATLGFDGRDPLAAVRDACVGIDEARPGIEAASKIDPPLAVLLEWLDNARGWFTVAEERHARVTPDYVEPTDLHGSVAVPHLHHVARSPLVPFHRAPAPKPRPEEPRDTSAPPVAPAKSFEELETRLAAVRDGAAARRAKHAAAKEARLAKQAERAKKPPKPEARPGFSAGPHRALTNADFQRDKARECIEEIGMLGMQRAPLLGDPWRSATIFEARLLSAVDALASLGSGGLAVLEELIAESPAKEPTKGFAAAFAGGCFYGRDALAMAERVARHLGVADEEVAKNVAGALKLVPHPALPAMLRAWAIDPEPALRAIAIEVLAYRGLADPTEIAKAARDADPLVKAAGIAAAGEIKHDDLHEFVEAGIEHEDPRVKEASMLAMVLGDTSYAADRIEKHLEGPLEDKAIVLLALGGEHRQAERIVERLRAGLTRPRVFAAGWAGSPLAFPLLLGGLRGNDTEIAIACALALERITGAALPEQIDVPPEKIDVPGDVEEPDVGEERQSFSRVISDPRDLPSDGAPDRMILPTIRHQRWKAWLDREAARFRPEGRYRRGQPFTPAVAFTELDRFPLLPAERRFLHRELIVRTGQFVRFDPHDFVPTQEEALELWGPHAYKASSTPGSWARARRVKPR